MELKKTITTGMILLLVWATLALLWASFFYRYTTNTASGRFYKNDRWTGKTIVVEKDGSVHNLAYRQR